MSDREWRLDIENAPKNRVIDVVGRLPEARSGFPQYAVWNNKKQAFLTLTYGVVEYPLVIWAWRERSSWPPEPSDAVH